MKDNGRMVVAVLVLAISGTSVAYKSWLDHEGFTAEPVIPTKGDVPTLGHGSTRWEDGTKVKMTDPPITRERAGQLALNLMRQDAIKFANTLPADAKLHPVEFDQYLDFTGQYGIGNWSKSSMRQHILNQEYPQACKALLKYRFAAQYDCSTTINGQPNRRCWGVWTRQLQRHDKCMAVQ